MKVKLTDNGNGTFNIHLTNVGGAPVPTAINVDLTVTPNTDYTPTATEKANIHNLSA